MSASGQLLLKVYNLSLCKRQQYLSYVRTKSLQLTPEITEIIREEI